MSPNPSVKGTRLRQAPRVRREPDQMIIGSLRILTLERQAL